MQRLLDGMATDDNALAREAYKEVPVGEHFLGCAHTLANYKTAFYDAHLSNSESFEQWTEEGAEDAVVRANKKWHQMLNHYVMPELDPGIDDALKAYIEKTKESRADAWY